MRWTIVGLPSVSGLGNSYTRTTPSRCATN